jgi:hypothetical protein
MKSGQGSKGCKAIERDRERERERERVTENEILRQIF